jgi:septal ring factor EnvC (AmiA/AmiB activator)
MRFRAAILALCLVLAPLAAGAQSVAEQARIAAQDLLAAIEDLETATSGREQIAALSRTIVAYEKGLATLRDALRQATIRETALSLRLEAKREQVSRLLGALSGMGAEPGPLQLLHPQGPVGMARAGMMLADVSGALHAEVDALRAELQEVADLRNLQERAARTLGRGLVAAQDARITLSQAMAERGPLPTRFIDDPDRLRLMIEDADTLDALANGLAPDLNLDGALRDFGATRGQLALPVIGQVLRRAGEEDAAGIARPGILIATRAQALVTAPWSGTIRYLGPFLDYGNVMILEPGAGYLLVLAGLGTVFGTLGEIVNEGAPLGLMGGSDHVESNLVSGTETLYIEIRQGGVPVDPGEWFVDAKE